MRSTVRLGKDIQAIMSATLVKMHVISRRKLNEFADKYPESRNALARGFQKKAIGAGLLFTPAAPLGGAQLVTP
jgi:hypothetical protein